MFFEITEHLFDPATIAIKAQSRAFVGQIGGQAPGFLFTALPIGQQVDPENVVARQVPDIQPETMFGFVDKTTEGLPILFCGEPKTGVGHLAQDVDPIPTFQLRQDGHGAEFTVTNQENRRPSRHQAAYIG